MAKKKLAGRKDNPKSRKRKIESTGEHQDYKRQHSTPRQAVSAPLQNSSEGNLGIYQRLDDETMKYILEVKSHFDTLMDARARSLLVCLNCLQGVQITHRIELHQQYRKSRLWTTSIVLLTLEHLFLLMCL